MDGSSAQERKPMAEHQQTDLTQLTVELLSAFVSNNNVRSEDLPALISSTHAALAGLGSAAKEEAPAEPEHTPAVTSRKSLASRDHILSMIDGKPYRSLKRHLAAHGLTPEHYRERYNLPSTYPMVAPGYSEQRREVAKRLGLGRKKGQGKSGTPGRVAGGGRKRASKDQAS
jgi:predicted transcriptional regulator